MVKVTWDPTMLKADPTKKMGKWNCYTKPADNADDVNMYGAMFDLNGNNAANGVIVFGGAAGYEFDDYTTTISLGTLKFTVLDAAAGKDVVITVDPVGTYATSLRGNEVLDTPVNATIKVAGAAVVEPEISGIEVTANAVEIADADKADEAKILEAVKAAITAITVKWTEGKADTTVAVADATYAVDTAANKVTVTYEGFTDEVTYTVAAPVVVPEISGIEVTANAVEIADADKADEAKILEAVKAAITAITVKWTEGKADTAVTVDDVTFAVDTAANTVTVTYEGKTDVVDYTVAAPIVKYTVTFKAEGADDIFFKVDEGTAIGDALAPDATKEGFEFVGWFTAEGVEITAETIVNGEIVAIAKFQRIAGDVNCDGVKDSKDAIYLLNHVALPDLYPVDDYEGTLDMNGDGDVSSLDAIYLLNSIAIPALYSLAW